MSDIQQLTVLPCQETALLHRHPARNYGDLLVADNIQSDGLVRRGRSRLRAAGLSPLYSSERSSESSEAMDTSTDYELVEAIVKRLAEEQP